MKRLMRGVALAAGAAAVAVGVRSYLGKRRAIAMVPEELRHPVLYAPFQITSRLVVRALARVPVRPGPVAPGVTLDQRDLPPEVFVYQPKARALPSGALLYIHGGGYVIGHPSTYHPICSRIAAELGVLVVSVNYRKAVGDPFPAGLDDCFRALTWIHEQASALGIDPARIAVAGDSAGGGLAAALAQMAYDRDVPLCFQGLIYPMLDDRTALRDDHLGTGELVWTPASNRFGWTSYLGHRPGEAEPRAYAVPARRDDLTGLAPAWIGVGDLDLFHAEDVEYAGRLTLAGVPTDLVVVPGMYHGADAFLADRAESMIAFRDDFIAALRKAIASRP
ncbi:alpha/beta hydrolase [Actinoplanes sp. NPDC049265]|uniref:alpha/beta hydrolase n=1 Tax=Actinoplanes sp. NPDC049265 TaxID=3363902 RepID=UPI00371F343F